MANEITPLVEQININTLLDQYEYNPNLYGLDEIDCAELTANNVCEMLREEMEDYTKRVMLEYENKLRDTDTLHIFCIICHKMWAEIESIQKYYFDECDKTRNAILEKMKCTEAAEHFEDYMNKPESGTRQTHALPYFDTDSVIDGTDKTPCMYDYVEDILNGRDDIAICRAAHKNSDGDCAQCTEPCCPKSGANNK